METIKRLVGNTVFPTAFVISGNLLNDWYQRSVISLAETQKSSTGVLVSNLAKNAYEGCSIANAKSLLSSVAESTLALGKSVYFLAPEPQVKTMAETLAAHSVEIGATAAIGATATVIDAVLKRIPLINRNGGVRVATSVGLASTAVYFGAKELKYQIDPAMLIDIGIKVAFIGLVWKGFTVAGEYTAKGLVKASPIVEGAFRKCCSIGEGFFHAVSYGELPAGVKVTAPKKRRERSEAGGSSEHGTPVRGGSSSKTGTPVRKKEDTEVGGSSSKTGTPVRKKEDTEVGGTSSKTGTPVRKKEDTEVGGSSSKPGTPVRKKEDTEVGGTSSKTGTPVRKKEDTEVGGSSSKPGTPAKELPKPQLPQQVQPVDEEEEVRSGEDSVVEHPTTPKNQKTGQDPNVTASGNKIEEVYHDVGEEAKAGALSSDGEDEAESSSEE
ncbi:MAG: hypothetical protein JSS30_01550 [Verrucomicrobia bacterium]|nr:hypothetical protein [Verrucomicrobiota bacterium]